MSTMERADGLDVASLEVTGNDALDRCEHRLA